MTESQITETALYLTFKMDEEVFAFDVKQVREILDMAPITKVPRAPEFMKGVINVRGSVVPVVDMRTKFGLAPAETTVDTRIVVMEVLIGEESAILGAMADSVHDVVELEPEQIEGPPRMGTRWRTEFIKGIGKQDETFIIIIDIDKLFSSDELAVVQDTTGASLDMEETELAA